MLHIVQLFMLRTLLAANYKTHAETQWIMTVRLGGLGWAGLGWAGLVADVSADK